MLPISHQSKVLSEIQPKIVEAWAWASVPVPARGETKAGTAMAVPARGEATAAAAAMAVAPAAPAIPAGEATAEDMVNSVAAVAIPAAATAEADTPWEPTGTGTICGTPARADALPDLAVVRPVQEERASLGRRYEWSRRHSDESRVVRQPHRRENRANDLSSGH